ncbi:HNH endonuclease signature motif containing protein [Mycolicibacterium pulveris]|nr:HNH endonuclease signature motif containing protein [Mycolicibacterium pulveris]
MYVRGMSGSGLQAAIAELRGAYEQVAACDLELLTRPDLLAALDEIETLSCQLPTMSQRLLARLQTETTPGEMGAHSWKEVLRVRYRISTSEANRRLAQAELLAPRQAVTGPALAPVLPATAAAQAHGLINAEHLEVIRKSMAKLPGWVDAITRDQFEVDLVRTAVNVGPKELTDTADLRLFLLDQDGPEPTDVERARKRGVKKSPQGPDGMVQLRAMLTPEAWAVWEAIFAKYAAPGMCNPDDPQPCTSGTPTQAQIDNDHRSLAQRQHDALIAVGRIALMSGELGQLNGLPVSVIIRTTLQDLESRAGIGTTGGGTVMPITDVIRLAGHANHYLAVFDNATGSALDLFRARRTASPAQRIMLIARDGGCTKPGCTVGAYGCQAHHVHADWAAGGNTNVDELGLACGPHNRSVNNDGGWSTRMNTHGEVEWLPPPNLDTGQARSNYYHRPERLLRPDDQPAGGDQVAGDEPRAATSTDPADEPGGPAPPGDQAA